MSYEYEQDFEIRTGAEDYHRELVNSKEHYNYTNMNTGDKGTAKVLSITANGTWESNYGTMYNQEVSLEINGESVTVQASSKNENPPYKVGDEIEYEFKNEHNGVFNAKLSKPQNTSFQKGGQKNSLASFALSYAKDYHTANGVGVAETKPAEVICATADVFLKWLRDND